MLRQFDERLNYVFNTARKNETRGGKEKGISQFFAKSLPQFLELSFIDTVRKSLDVDAVGNHAHASAEAQLSNFRCNKKRNAFYDVGLKIDFLVQRPDESEHRPAISHLS